MSTNERLTGSEPPEVVERHVARYVHAIGLTGRVGGVWWDVGSGTGYGSVLLPGNVYAFDRFECAPPPRAPGEPFTRKFIVADIAHAGWSTEAPDPDVVICIETLEHLDRYDQDGLIDSIAARLNIGGVLVLACPIGDDGPSPTNRWHLHEPTEPGLRALLSRHFSEVSIEVEEYESTSGPAVQALAVARRPK